MCQKTNRHKNLKLRSNKDHQRNTFPSWRWICSKREACTCRKNHLKPFAEVITSKRQCSAHQRQFFISNPAQMPSPAIKLGSQFIWFSFCPFHCIFGWAGFTFPSLVASNYTSQFLRGKNRNERSDTSLITESCTPAYKWPVAHTNYLTRLCTKRGCYRSSYRAPGCLSATFWGKTGHYAMQLKPVLPKIFWGKLLCGSNQCYYRSTSPPMAAKARSYSGFPLQYFSQFLHFSLLDMAKFTS